MPSTPNKRYKNKQTTKVATKPVHCCEKQQGKIFPPPRQKTKHVSVSTKLLLSADREHLLAAEWMVTAHLLLPDVCVSVAAAQLSGEKVPYSFSSPACCNFYTPFQNRTASTSVFKKKIIKKEQKTSSGWRPRERDQAPSADRITSCAPSPYRGVRPCAHAPAHTRAHRKRDNSTSARQHEGGEGGRRGGGEGEERE